MTTHETKILLFEKMNELASSQVGRADIAIEKTADEMDEIQRGAERALALDSMTRHWETSTLIAEALERIKNDTYGTCAECDEQISPRRLKAIPWARYCITCQEHRDRLNANFQWDTAA